MLYTHKLKQNFNSIELKDCIRELYLNRYKTRISYGKVVNNIK